MTKKKYTHTKNNGNTKAGHAKMKFNSYDHPLMVTAPQEILKIFDGKTREDLAEALANLMQTNSDIEQRFEMIQLAMKLMTNLLEERETSLSSMAEALSESSKRLKHCRCHPDSGDSVTSTQMN